MTNLNGKFTYNEIISQDEVWKKTLEGSDRQIKFLKKCCNHKHDEVIFIGCGSTYYLSLSAARIWTLLTNESARAIPSSELWYYPDVQMSSKVPLLIAVSRSGETTETINAIELFKKKVDGDVLVVSCYPESKMVKDSKWNLLADHAQESSIAQTRSFSSMYILCQLFAGYYSDNLVIIEEMQQLPTLFSQIVKKYEGVIKAIAENPMYNHFVFLGSGLNFGLASEVMLKMKEMSTSVSEVFHFMEFRHGPMSMITKHSLVIGLISEKRKNEELKVLSDMKGLGATTIAVVNDAESVNADFIFELETMISDAASSILKLPLLQLLAFYHSLSKGKDPDHPTNLSSVVYL